MLTIRIVKSDYWPTRLAIWGSILNAAASVIGVGILTASTIYGVNDTLSRHGGFNPGLLTQSLGAATLAFGVGFARAALSIIPAGRHRLWLGVPCALLVAFCVWIAGFSHLSLVAMIGGVLPFLGIIAQDWMTPSRTLGRMITRHSGQDLVQASETP